MLHGMRVPHGRRRLLPRDRTVRYACLLFFCASWVSAQSSAVSRDQIVVVGSSTVFPFSALVAEHFAKSGSFASPAVRTTSTGDGFRLFCAGVGPDTPDINDASRQISPAEKALCAANGVKKITEVRIGYDSLIFARSRRTAAFAVTLRQLWLAAARTVPINGRFVPNPYRSWHDIAATLPDEPIRLFGPSPGHGTRDAFVELVMQPSCVATSAGSNLTPAERESACGTLRADGRWIDVENIELTLGKLASHPEAVGVLTYSYLEQFSDRIHASSIDGVAPSRASISSGTYPISRPLYIYLKDAHLASITGLADYASEFLSFCAAGASGYLSDEGLVPMPTPELLHQRAAVARLQR